MVWGLLALVGLVLFAVADEDMLPHLTGWQIRSSGGYTPEVTDFNWAAILLIGAVAVSAAIGLPVAGAVLTARVTAAKCAVRLPRSDWAFRTMFLVATGVLGLLPLPFALALYTRPPGATSDPPWVTALAVELGVAVSILLVGPLVLAMHDWAKARSSGDRSVPPDP